MCPRELSITLSRKAVINHTSLRSSKNLHPGKVLVSALRLTRWLDFSVSLRHVRRAVLQGSEPSFHAAPTTSQHNLPSTNNKRSSRCRVFDVSVASKARSAESFIGVHRHSCQPADSKQATQQSPPTTSRLVFLACRASCACKSTRWS